MFSICIGLALGLLWVCRWPRLPEPSEWWIFPTVLAAILLILWRIRAFEPSTKIFSPILLAFLGLNMGTVCGCLTAQRLLSSLWPDELGSTTVFVAGEVVGLPETLLPNPLKAYQHITQSLLTLTEADPTTSQGPSQGPSSPLINTQTQQGSTRFLLAPLEVRIIEHKRGQDLQKYLKSPPQIKKLPSTIQFYSDGILSLKPKHRLCFVAKIKALRGWHNSIGMNQRLTWLRKGIKATGQVEQWRSIQKCDHLWSDKKLTNWVKIRQFWDQIRDQARQIMAKNLSQHPMKPFVQALSLGDNRGITQHQWRLLRASGTAHLIAISGLHIGLVATFGFLIGRCLTSLINTLFSPFSLADTLIGTLILRTLPPLIALISSAIYSALAGMSLPTQRALIMVLGVLVAWVLGKRVQKRFIWLYSLIIVLLIDPLAPYFAGFWLSFLAVGGLLYRWQGFYARKDSSEKTKNLLTVIYGLISSQWILFWVLFIPAWLWHTDAGFFSVFFNLIAIPWVSFVVIPLLMISGFLFFLAQWLLTDLVWVAAQFLILSADCLLLLIKLVQWGVSIIPSINIYKPPLSLLSISWVLICVATVLWPTSNIRIKCLATGCFLIIFWRPIYFTNTNTINNNTNTNNTNNNNNNNNQDNPNHTHNPALSLTVFDVGQGLSVWIQTPRHRLLYDTGNMWNGFARAAQTVIYPHIIRNVDTYKKGLPNVDTLMVSHSDRDHSGGVPTLIEKVHFDRIISPTSIQIRSLTSHRFLNDSFPLPVDVCRAGMEWQWDKITFRTLWPSGSILGVPYSKKFQQQKSEIFAKPNNQSCVLLIQLGYQSVLLSGDIEKEAEWQLLREHSNVLKQSKPFSVLVAPHHCSRTSSSLRWVSQIQPQTVICSSGYLNAYGHPSSKVVERYQSLSGSQVLNTATEGAITLTWTSLQSSNPQISRERRHKRRYWMSRM